jgi:hypothetical protein
MGEANSFVEEKATRIPANFFDVWQQLFVFNSVEGRA